MPCSRMSEGGWKQHEQFRTTDKRQQEPSNSFFLPKGKDGKRFSYFSECPYQIQPTMVLDISAALQTQPELQYGCVFTHHLHCSQTECILWWSIRFITMSFPGHPVLSPQLLVGGTDTKATLGMWSGMATAPGVLLYCSYLCHLMAKALQAL